MIDRDKRGIRSVGVKARLAVAAAVLVGGGAAGVVALANHSGSAAATTAESAGYTRSVQHPISEPLALTEALGSWSSSPSKAVAVLAEMTQLRSFVQLNVHHTTIAAQRGIVVLATKKFLVVRSFNGSLHLWWWNGATAFKNVDATTTGWTALTGSHPAATAAMAGNMTPASTVMAGSAAVVRQLTTSVAEPTRIKIITGGQVITITVAGSTATVTQPGTTTAPTTRTRQSAWWATHGVQRGDLVFVAGTRTHGLLKAELVLFAPPRTSMPRPSASPTPTAVPSPNTTINGQPAVIGSHS
jgi:hypothetical protein